MDIGDRVRYVGRREKYQNVLGVIGSLDGFIGKDSVFDTFVVRFDDGQRGIFSHMSDFVIASAVDELAAVIESHE